MSTLPFRVLLPWLLAAGRLAAQPSYVGGATPRGSGCFVGGCHSYASADPGAGIWIEHINGVTQSAAPYSVSVLPGQSFTLDFRAKGLNDVATQTDHNISGVIQVEDMANWSAANGPTWTDNGFSGATPWHYRYANVYLTNFTAAESSQGSVAECTSDVADAKDKNGIGADEVMSVTLAPSVYVPAGPHTVTVTALSYHRYYGSTLFEVPITVNVGAPLTPVPTPSFSASPTRSPTPTLSPSFSATPTNVPGCNSTVAVGDASIEPWSSIRASTLNACRYPVTVNGTLSSLSLYLSPIAAGNLSMALYSDAGGVPGALLSSGSGSYGAGAGRWVSVTVTAVAVSPGTYWLAWQQSSTALTYFHYTNFGDTVMVQPYAYGAFPAAFPAITKADQDNFSILAAVCVNGSPTPTRTPPGSPSPTRSPSPSPSASATASASPSATGSRTASPSATATPSPSATPTGTRTASPSPTASPSATASPTGTGSVTASPTLSNSPSATQTPSASPTVTPSATPVPTNSSPTDSPTLSPSFTVSPTATPSATPSASPTASPTGTGSVTESPTISNSPSATQTPSASPTATPSASPTATPSASPTATPSASPSASPTPSATPSPSASSSASPSASITPTATLSPTASPSPSVTASFSASPTASVTPTRSPSATLSPTPSVSPVLTATPSPLPAVLAFPEIDRLVAVPNPAWNGRFQARFHLLAPAGRVRLRLFTPALVDVWAAELGAQGQGWHSAAVDLQAEIPAQTYFLVAQVIQGPEQRLSPACTVVVLR